MAVLGCAFFYVVNGELESGDIFHATDWKGKIIQKKTIELCKKPMYEKDNRYSFMAQILIIDLMNYKFQFIKK